MRIINGKDYYDNALAYGRDENIILVREKNNIMSDDEVGHFNHRIYKPDLTFTIGKIKYIINRVYVIFCGKLYYGVRTKTEKGYISSPDHFIWNNAEFEHWILENNITHLHDSNFCGVSDIPDRLPWMIENNIVSAIYFPEYLDRRCKICHALYSENFTIIANTKTRSCIGGHQTESLYWLINSDRLKSVQFFKVFDHYAAFQEISMWVGGVLTNHGNPMVEISDIIRVEKHGFDKKKSFRKDKE